MATRGDAARSGISMVKLEELDDEKTYIAFDAQKNELYVQINAHNYSDSNIGIYLLCENKKIIEVPVVLENGCKLRSNGMPVPLLRNCYSIFNGTKYR